MHPIIGITARPKTLPSAENDILAHLVFHTYSDSVLRGGGIPILILPVEDELLDTVLDRIDGLVFTGGGDIGPEHYGAERDDSVMLVNDERDDFELSLIQKACERKMPTMAICRGTQILNVALGGTLIQDLPSHADTHGHNIEGDDAYEPHAEVMVDGDSRIGRIIGGGLHGINSIHHQAVDRVADGLRVVATAPDGTVEALEHADSDWPLIAVQWHPEYLGVREHGESHDLFTAFVETAAKYSANT